ncbi:MAG: DUF1385 domain-containing protein [Anaerovoracaceae bacterium]
MDLSRIFLKNACPTSIGGQAIMEGIMMRGPEKTAVAVRLADGSIHMKTQPTPKASKWGKIPIIRGVVNFVGSMVQGTKVLMYSADVLEENYPEEYEKDKFDIWIEEKLGKEKAWKFLMIISVLIAIVAAVAIFMLLPTVAVGWLSKLTDSIILLNLAEGALRMIIFVAYIMLISKMNDIKTVFQYHGAEHKTIHCFENNQELTPENAQKFYTLHPRCGTSFLMFVMVIAVLTHALMGWPNVWLRIISRVLVLPLIAGLSYELLKWAGRSDNWVVKILSLPGIYLQKLTTREPSEKQLEVAIAAMKAVLPGNKTPYYEGLCDLNGEPLKNETAAGESNAAAEPVAIAGDSAADKPAAVQTGMDGEESEMAGEENPTVPKENDNELTS